MESHEIDDELIRLLLTDEQVVQPISYDFSQHSEQIQEEPVTNLYFETYPAIQEPVTDLYFETYPEMQEPVQNEPQSLIEDTIVVLAEEEQVRKKRKFKPITSETPARILNDLESIISGYKVSDIYARVGPNKSYLQPNGQKLRRQIYDYFTMNKFSDENIDMALNLMKSRSIDFLLRLFDIGFNPQKKKQKADLIFEHIRNNLSIPETRKFTIEELETLLLETQPSSHQLQESKKSKVGNPKDIVLAELDPYLKDARGLFKTTITENGWGYMLTDTGKKLKSEVEKVFSNLEFSRNDIVNILSSLDNRYISKIYKVIFSEFSIANQPTNKEKIEMIHKLADKLQNL